MNLLVLNYSMNSQSQLFSHQRRIVEQLSEFFDHVDVITAEDFQDLPLRRVNIRSTNWITGRNISNVLNFYRVAIPLLWKHRGGTVFSHMTQIQTLLALPISRLFRLRHFLWFAHRSPSISLKISYPFLDAVITSTPGSCPISGKKVMPIGQAVDSRISNNSFDLQSIPPQSFYHIGRMDPSKNIESIVHALLPFRKSNNAISLTLYGAPSSENTANYFERLKHQYSSSEYSNWVSFKGAIDNINIARISSQHDAFIHAFWGSLDKTLIEATLLKRIVLSSNPEYLKEFYGKVITKEQASEELVIQLTDIFTSSNQKIIEDINRKFDLAIANHSLDKWITRLSDILRGK